MLPYKKSLLVLAMALPLVSQAATAPAWSVLNASKSAASSLVVTDVVFSGNQLFSQDELLTVIEPNLGQAMTLDQIKELAGSVTTYYHDRGYKLTRVVVPEQKFSSKKPVEMVVLEGRLSSIQVTGAERFRSERVAQALGAYGVQEGQPFTFTSVEQGLTQLNRLSGVSTTATLKPGEEQGSTTIEVVVKESPRVSGAVEINNYGSKSTGRNRLMPSVDLKNLTGIGDVLSVLVLRSLSGEGTTFGRVSYQRPIGFKGYKFGAFYSQGDTTVGGSLAALDVRGDNQSIGFGVLKENIRSAQRVDTLEAWLESHDLRQEALGTTTSDDKVRKLRLGYTTDRSVPGARTVLSLQAHQGLGSMLGGMPNGSKLSSRAVSGADNQFTKVTADWSHMRRLGARALVIPRLSAQFTTNPLVVGEQISIGGAYSIAGQTPSAFSGDYGIVANLEGRYAVRENDDRFQYLARLDHGHVFVNKTFIGQRKQNDLTGAAIGLIANPIPNLSMRLEYARPIGEKTDDSQYIYAQLRYQF